MKKLLAVLSVTALLSPAFALAAATDVSLDTTVVLSVGGIEVDVSGAIAVVESITVNASTFSFNLQSGSSIEVTAPGRNILTSDTSSDRVTNTCTSSQSILKYVGTAARTVTVTPSATLCSSAQNSHSGSSATRAKPAVPTVLPAVPATSATPASCLSAPQIQAILDVLASFNADADVIVKVEAALYGTCGITTTTSSVTSTTVWVFKTNLTIGSLGGEVKMLQEFLNAHGYVISASGAGSPGNETSFFGPLTRAAVMKYQKAKGITPAVGYFGAITRASVNSEQ